ncbi:hypothetical protein CA54_54010 [Symmachiella macrocystis]|uniref:Uncharacterized protein n=1 Tax=Symmachiella macrocystis TaxID=2527985 RepID=A0A5C6B5G7_9PLAN|nr:hypothetical protein CA54_54010 [Symmachiella macrocystis]
MPMVLCYEWKSKIILPMQIPGLFPPKQRVFPHSLDCLRSTHTVHESLEMPVEIELIHQ